MWHQQRWRWQWWREQWCMGRACSSMQQRRRRCNSKQRALVEPQVAADGGRITMDGRQPACVQQQAADAGCMHQREAERHVCNNMQRQRCVCGSGWEQPAAWLQWKTVMAASGGGSAKSSGWQLLLANVWNFHTGIMHKIILGSLPKIFYINSKCIVHTI